MQNPYIDSDSGVFKNKLGVSDADELHKKEYIATSNFIVGFFSFRSAKASDKKGAL